MMERLFMWGCVVWAVTGLVLLWLATTTDVYYAFGGLVALGSGTFGATSVFLLRRLGG